MNIIPDIQQVVSLDIPELEPYLTLKRPLDHIQAGIFIAEGEKVVRRLLDSELKIDSMLLTKQWYDKLITDNRIKAAIKIYLAEKSLLESIVGFNLHQGIMAVAKVPKQLPLNEMVQKIPKPYFLVALDGLVNAENVGVVVRNCVGFGVDCLIVGETSSSPYLRRAVRNSMGTIFKLPVFHADNLIDTLRTIQTKYETKIIATHPHERHSIYDMDFRGNICIVLGNEGDGVSQKVLDVCDYHIAVPMMNGTDSLNVASASAIFFYEIRKQIGDKKPALD